MREVFGSALDAATRTLHVLGYEEKNAERIVQRFREYDEAQLAQNAHHRNDIDQLIALTRQGRRDIAQLLAAEARSAPQIDQNDANGNEERREHEIAGERLVQK